MELADGSSACQCDHLSEFVSLKVPTSFDDKIQFASLDVPTELCLHCACTKGVELMLTKSDEPGASNLVRQDVDLLNLAHEHQLGGTLVAWRLHNLTVHGVAPPLAGPLLPPMMPPQPPPPLTAPPGVYHFMEAPNAGPENCWTAYGREDGGRTPFCGPNGACCTTKHNSHGWDETGCYEVGCADYHCCVLANF